MSPIDYEAIQKRIKHGLEKSGKNYTYNENHFPGVPAAIWFQESFEGLVLFVEFYTQACQWNMCTNCSLPSKCSEFPVHLQHICMQIDHVFSHPKVMPRLLEIKKMIISNNGSVLDHETFPRTCMMHLIYKINQHLPNLVTLCAETRIEYVTLSELDIYTSALREVNEATKFELAIGCEAFDDDIRNEKFKKGLIWSEFETLLRKANRHGVDIKCYFMQKPLSWMSDEDAVLDIQKGIDYLDKAAKKYDVNINMHINPTCVVHGATDLVEAFEQGKYYPPYLIDVAKAALHAKGKKVTIFVGLNDEGMGIEGGSFLRESEEHIKKALHRFNITKDHTILEKLM